MSHIGESLVSQKMAGVVTINSDLLFWAEALFSLIRALSIMVQNPYSDYQFRHVH